LHRQRRQWRLALVDEGFVELAQLAGEDVHGPAFGDDVVQGQHEVVFTVLGLGQAGAQQRATLQVEWLVGLVVSQLLQTLLTGIGRQRREVLPGQLQPVLGKVVRRVS
jgi:hypothetical protein